MMAITDAERHQLHSKLDVVLGPEDAAVLISHLPPSGWSDVARTRDLDVVESRLDTKIDHVAARLEARIDRVEARLESRIDEVEARLESRIERLGERTDGRVATMEARMDASIERAIREQTNRFLVYTGALVAIATTVQGVVVQIFGG
jgi:hypothetical protein